uniref:Uncharacterized protein n=1 Tax=Pipistrellus kuhlii TaxID=59472 RepID=A0A7J7RA49_PIPKU|nr:hypothetical protein mPipKuh1_010703 [Pipistrellus kuhlii]
MVILLKRSRRAAPGYRVSPGDWGRDCRGELGQVSGAFCSIRAGFSRQVCVPAEAWPDQPRRGGPGHGACELLTRSAHPQARGRGDSRTLQKRVLWETEVVTHFCDFHKLHSMSKISEKSSPTPKQP